MFSKAALRVCRGTNQTGAGMARSAGIAYVERCLAPTLKRKDIVMIDNLPRFDCAPEPHIPILVNDYAATNHTRRDRHRSGKIRVSLAI
jgi:hypothetical protein